MRKTPRFPLPIATHGSARALATLCAAMMLAACGRAPDEPVDSAPAAVLPPIARTLAAGEGYVLAIDARGSIYGWGDNARGELGLAGACSLSVPKLIDGTRRWRAVDAGTKASYALTRDGSLWRRPFSNGSRGDCASGKKPPAYEPVRWDNRWLKVQEAWGIAAGIDSGGSLSLWNEDDLDADAYAPGPRGEPVAVEPRKHWQDFCVAIHRIYAVAEDGSLWTNSVHAGAFDRMRAKDLAKLEPVPGKAPPLARVFCRTNASHVLALDTQGALYGLGLNTFGELGDGDGDSFTQTKPVTELKRVTKERWNDIAVGGGGFSIGIRSDGVLMAWGNNAHDNLGVGSSDYSNAPRAADAAHAWTAIAAGIGFALGATRDGEMLAWGQNAGGVLGDGGGASVHSTPTRVYGKENWTMNAGGNDERR
jgi:alpha-tubulin suppressor-like RCC1 family protein